MIVDANSRSFRAFMLIVKLAFVAFWIGSAYVLCHFITKFW